MRISDLIAYLHTIQSNLGNLEVVMEGSYSSSGYIDINDIFQVDRAIVLSSYTDEDETLIH